MVYGENMWIKRHIVLFIVTNYQMGVYIENMCLFIHMVPFYSYKLSNMDIQGNENSFFTWYLKFAPKESKTHY